jgi:hypothetical protein
MKRTDWPRVSKEPIVWKRVGGSWEGNAEDDEENVGHGQVQDQQVRRVPHLLVEAHNKNDLVKKEWKFRVL